MRDTLLALSLLAFSAFAFPASAQQPVFTALPVLEIPASPSLGGAAAGRLSDDPRAALQNPALLGLSAGTVRQATAVTPDAAWFGEQSMSLAASSFGVELGRLDLGLAVSQGTLGADARTLADGTDYDPTDRYRALSAGLATRGPVRLALGAAARYVTTTDAPRWTGERFDIRTLRGVTADLGVAVSADVLDLAGSPALGALRPALDVTAGYAQSHLGGTVRYAGYEKQSLPRTAALGWSAVGGLDLAGSLRLIEAEVAVQADQSLVREEDGVTRYDWAVGSLSPRSALLGTGGERTTGRRGVRVELAETIALSTGRFDGWGYTNAQTRSIELSTAGAFALLAGSADGGALADLRQLDLRVGRMTVWAGTPEATARTTVSLVLVR